MSFYEFCRTTTTMPIKDMAGNNTDRFHAVRYKALESGVPLDDWVGKSVVQHVICCDRFAAYSQEKIRLYFMDPNSRVQPSCNLSPHAPGLVTLDSAFKHVKNGMLGDEHDRIIARIASGINHFPITTIAGAALHSLSL